MDQRLAAAEAALKAGRAAEGIGLLIAVAEADPAQSVEVYRALLLLLHNADRNEEAARWGDVAVQRHPRDLEILNGVGIVNRRLGNYARALEVLDQAIKLAPNNMAVASNRGNVLLDLKQPARAEVLFGKLVRADPKNPEHQRQLGRAMADQGKRSHAAARYRQAVTLKKDYLDAWIDLINLELDDQRPAEAHALIDRALTALPDHPRLHEARALTLRHAGQLRACEAYLTDLLPRLPNAAWLHYHLGSVIAVHALERSIAHLRRAHELEPGRLDYAMGLIEGLNHSDARDEGAHIEEAYQLALATLAAHAGPLNPGHTKILFEVFLRVSAFDDLERLANFEERGRGWVTSGRHTALLLQLGRVKTLEDRHELLEQHRIWGRAIEKEAAKSPIRKPPPRPAGGKIRLGIMSSDLRHHVVAFFAMPLFEHADRERFEIYCYSFYRGEQADPVQQTIAGASTAFRQHPDISNRDAAQMIADDQLDILIELGGSTHMNKPEVLAWRPAPIQASWLGYPHSAGLSSIDYLLCDPYNAPPRRDLLIEKPLMMPQSWISLGGHAYADSHVIAPGLPEDRNGRITFGTANNPHKYNRETIALWAEAMRAVPGSRFLFVRPEAGAESFRRHLTAEFARHGIEEDRLAFSALRGAHMPAYNEIDISLDTAPLTGGTTTTDSLWMGVPVVSLIGEAFFERLSYSILANSGLADLAAETPADYVRIATDLVADRERRLALRGSLREAIRSGPLGQTGQFAKDFYDLIAATVRPQA